MQSKNLVKPHNELGSVRKLVIPFDQLPPQENIIKEQVNIYRVCWIRKILSKYLVKLFSFATNVNYKLEFC